MDAYDSSTDRSTGPAGEEAARAAVSTTCAHKRRLQRCARVLPLVTVTAWVLTLFIPILDSGGNNGHTIKIYSLGDWPVDLADLESVLVMLWVLVLTLAILCWTLPTSMWWAVAALVVAGVIVFGLAGAIVHPPIMMWDGFTDEGMPIGGMDIGRPALGFLFCAVGASALAGAGISALLAQLRPTRRHRRTDRSSSGAKS